MVCKWCKSRHILYQKGILKEKKGGGGLFKREKNGGSGGPPPENFYKWYANGANLCISGKFDPLFHSLALAYF